MAGGGSVPDSWARRGLPAEVGWYRTSFNLNLGTSGYHPVAVQLGNDVVGGAGAVPYRAFIFVNGYLMGQYDNVLGPHPSGVLNDNGANTLAIAVWGLEPDSGRLPQVSLQSVGDQTGGVPVTAVPQPGWNAHTYGPPTDSTPTLGERAGSAPAGWTVSGGGGTAQRVAPGAARTVRFTVTVPSSGLTPGAVDLVATAHYTERGTAQSQMSSTQLQVPQSSLAASFDNTGITDQSTPESPRARR